MVPGATIQSTPGSSSLSDLETLRSPIGFLELRLPKLSEVFRNFDDWWQREGSRISDAVDRAGTPWLRMFDRAGKRVDEILFPPEYWKELHKGYDTGTVWRAFEEKSLLSCALLGYITCFYDPGLACPYTVSLATALAIDKYGDEELKARFLKPMLRRDGAAWQGATWMTEIRGGSDLGGNVETAARPRGRKWLLTGDKYFASNAGAELAVVAARPEGAPHNVRGLALFLVPKWRENGELNYSVRRLKDKVATRSVPTGEVELRDSEGYLLGDTENGIHLILEVLNLSRATNAMGSVAIAQRAMAEALAFAKQRVAFGKPVLEQPLLRKQFEERFDLLDAALALALETVRELDAVWREKAPYSERYHCFRLIAHLAKYWTSELAPEYAKWAMEVHGALGVLGEFPVERWFREAMVLTIWEGTSHRQILDGMEVMERKGAHRLLFERLAPVAQPEELERIRARVEHHLTLPQPEREAGAEEVFRDLAVFTSRAFEAM